MPEPGENLAVECPCCGGAVGVAPADRAEVVACPHCAESFVLPAADGIAPRVADIGGDEAADGSDDLDGMRIRQVHQMRRSIYRTRRYWLVGAGLCLVAAGQIVWKFYSPEGWVAMSGVQVVVLAIAFLLGGIYCMRQARDLGRAAGTSALPEPERPPDFSALSDGSQHWKNLEAMGGEDPRDTR